MHALLDTSKRLVNNVSTLFSGRKYVPFYYWSLLVKKVSVEKVSVEKVSVEKVSVEKMSVEKTSRCHILVNHLKAKQVRFRSGGINSCPSIKFCT